LCRALTSWVLVIVGLPLIPTSRARLTRSSLLHSGALGGGAGMGVARSGNGPGRTVGGGALGGGRRPVGRPPQSRQPNSRVRAGPHGGTEMPVAPPDHRRWTMLRRARCEAPRDTSSNQRCALRAVHHSRRRSCGYRGGQPSKERTRPQARQPPPTPHPPPPSRSQDAPREAKSTPAERRSSRPRHQSRSAQRPAQTPIPRGSPPGMPPPLPRSRPPPHRWSPPAQGGPSHFYPRALWIGGARGSTGCG
jgi:hypothetical protein